MAAISNLCSQTILLENGQISLNDVTNRVIESYLAGQVNTAEIVSLIQRKDRLGNGYIRFQSIHWETEDGKTINTLQSGKNYRLVITFERHHATALNNVIVAFAIKDLYGTVLLNHQTAFSNENFSDVPRSGKFVCSIPQLPLANGHYSLGLHLGTTGETYDNIPEAHSITVESGDFFGTGSMGDPDYCKLLHRCHWSLRETNLINT
jgi:lipopolysaccharide transport system ATP-binding protein